MATLHSWLSEVGELYVHLHLPRSGGSGPSYRMKRLGQARDFMSTLTWPWLEVWFYGRLQYPIRGLADDRLLERALSEIPDGTWYEINGLNELYPKECGGLGCGETHADLREDFENIRGKQVALGPIPIEGPQGEDRWVYDHPDEVLYISYACNDYYRKSKWSRDEIELARAVWEEEV